VNALENIHELQ